MHPEVMIHTHPYCFPKYKKQVVREELTAMLNMGVIKESHSAWSSLLVSVSKADGLVQFCVDM